MPKSKLNLEVEYYGGQINNLTPNSKWVSLHRIQVPQKGIQGYDYSHDVHGHGHGVAVLPYRQNKELLLRKEIVPPWGLSPSLCSITGSWDHPEEDFLQTAVRELHEEAGYLLTPSEVEDRFLSLGTCRVSKATDSVYHLYAVDVTGLIQEEPPGDGSELERQATTEWVTDIPDDLQDPLVAVILLRLMKRFS